MTTQLTTEDVQSIDIRWLKRNGFLNTHGVGILTWTSYGKTTASIRYTMADDRMTLNYSGNDNPFNYSVMFDITPCHLGGYRKWFKCPSCTRRCAVVYLSNLAFKCRKCARLPYLSTLQSDIERMIKQKHKLGYRIFEGYDGEGFWKKKHMQQKTFERLLKRYDALDQEIDRQVYLRFKECG